MTGKHRTLFSETEIKEFKILEVQQYNTIKMTLNKIKYILTSFPVYNVLSWKIG